MEIKRISAAGGGYSDVVAIDEGRLRWLYVAGQTARGNPVPDDLGAQAEMCLTQLETLIDAWGAGLENVVRMTTYLTDLSEYGAFAQARKRHFGSEPPSSTAIEISALLDNRLIEIDAVAVVPRASTTTD
jgi:enamine deaminase RidA (YjgF/YER057c/UK114 family)